MHSFALALPALFTGSLAFAPYSDALQNILKNTDNSDKYSYPTDFTRDIVPKPIHSHNDYWRDVPFYTGLSYGAISTEADVWLINETLYVGHEPSALTSARTLSSLYIQPILTTLHRMNPKTPFTQGKDTQNGLFDTSSAQTLYFFIDLKTSPDTTWPAVLSALAPLRRENWLTTYTTDNGLIHRPITVIATGNARLSDVQTYLPRDVFLDAPLAQLSEPEYANLSPAISPIASTDFFASFGAVRAGTFNNSQLSTLRSQVARAHEMGIMARYWNQPLWPVGARNAVWRTLWEEGVDLVNVDDLQGAVGVWERG